MNVRTSNAGIRHGHPTVSVVVPVFNDAEGANLCLAALARQDYPLDRFEVVVVDNGSQPPLNIDAPPSLVVRKIECVTPGAYAARNEGVLASRGDFLAFTDADCIPSPCWISAGTRALLALGAGTVVGGDVAFFPPTRRNGASLYQFETGFQQKENIEYKGFGATANLLCSRRQFEIVGPFDQRLLSGADREWAWRAAKHGISISYCADARVQTNVRSTLGGAIRQARRVAAGRRYIARNGLGWIGDHAVRPHRSSLGALYWIVTRRQLSPWERLRVLSAAIVIRIATLVENFRLALGSRPERR